MSDNLDFINTSTADIYETVISMLEEGVDEELYPGDERRMFGEALVALISALFASVNDACRQRMLKYARNTVLDAIGDTRGVYRIPSVPAETTERFMLSTALNVSVTIPAGTRVTCDFERYFATKEDVVIPIGSTYVDVAVTAAEGGTYYNNIDVGKLSILVDMIPYVESVANLTATSGGAEAEDDDRFRERIRLGTSMYSVAGPKNAYRYYAMSADPTIADAAVDSPEAGVVRIIPICEGGTIPSADILAKVLEKCSADDVRPITDRVIVQAPETYQYSINLVYYTTEAKEAECVAAVEGEGGAIERYIAWQGEALGRNINPDQLRKYILSPDWSDAAVGADRLTITSPAYTVLADNTVAVFSGTINVTHVVEEA